MDAAQKSKIRRFERRFYVVVETVLLISILAMIYTAAMRSIVVKSFVKLTLAHASANMFDAYLLYEKTKLRELAAFTPPCYSCERAAWAGEVQKFLDQPVSVFIREGGEIVWLLKSETLENLTERVPALFGPGGDTTGKVDTLGNQLLRHTFLTSQKAFDGNVWIYGSQCEEMRWGVLFRFQDGWKPFLKGLERAKLRTEMESAAQYAKNYIQISPPLQSGMLSQFGTDKSCMKASVNNEVLFRSPGLDTTKRSGDVVLPYVKMEFFLSDEDEMYAKTMGDAPLPWGKVIILLCFMAVVYRVHKWIWELTEEEVPEKTAL